MQNSNISRLKLGNGGGKKNFVLPLLIIIILFFMWGFITCMNDILIPHFKTLFVLSHFQVMLVQFCFFGAYFIGSAAYFIISLYKGDPINRFGYKKGIIAGLMLSALGCLLFFPAGNLSVYAFFLLALFVLGLGFTLLQITANVYVSLLGKPQNAAGRLNLAQAFNSLGTTIAPLIGGYLIFSRYSDSGHLQSQNSNLPYLAFAVVFLLLALIFYLVKLPDLRSTDEQQNRLGVLAFPHLKLGVLAIFCYVGAEVSIGSFMINFLGQKTIMGLPEIEAKNYLSLYWCGAMAGRFSGSVSLNSNYSAYKKIILMALISVATFFFALKIIDIGFDQIKFFIIFLLINLLGFVFGKSTSKVLLFFALINFVLLLFSIMNNGLLAAWCILGMGLFNSIMWSNIFTLSINGLGKYAAQGSSLLIMAILGGATVPLVQGGIADKIEVHFSFIVPAICYLYIAFFGWYCIKNLRTVND